MLILALEKLGVHIIFARIAAPMYEVTQKLQFYIFLSSERSHTFLVFPTMQWINNFLVSRKSETKNTNKTLKNQITIFTRPKSLSLKPRKL
jgi:hypothetical protein